MALEDVYQRNLHHRTHRAGWLRAAVLGANDGLVSTASLMIGVAAARSEQSFLITAGAAGIAAGAMSMAVGEYVSVRSQNDIEESDRLLEIEHLAIDPEGEFEELVHIYIERGLTRELAVQVVTEMHKKRSTRSASCVMNSDSIPHTKARPVQAAVASAMQHSLQAGWFHLPEHLLRLRAPRLGALLGSHLLVYLQQASSAPRLLDQRFSSLPCALWPVAASVWQSPLESGSSCM